MYEILSRSIPYKNFTNPMAIMHYISIEKGRPDLDLIDSNCPEMVIIKFLNF